MPTRHAASIRVALATALVALALTFAVPAVMAATRGVAIRDFAFSPGTVEIRVGDTVTWRNRDSVAHTATARNGSFDTGLLAEGASGSVRFTAAGTYRYVCTPHPEMTGTVVVRSAGTIAPPNTATEDVADGSGAGAGWADAPLALLAVMGALGLLLPQRLVRRNPSP